MSIRPRAQGTSNSAFEEIVVTAQRREQSIYDVPVAISAFSPETIERQGITDLVDLGKFVPNLNVTGFSAGHTSSANPFIRGIGLQDHLITTEPGVGVYVDGIYLGRQVGQNWNLTNIERVEVLRGPQGTLYGRNSIGGAINIITRKPGDEEGGKVSLMAGSRGRLNGDAYTNMRLTDQLAMSFTVAYQRRDGLGDFLLIEDPNKEVGEMQDISGRVALLWEPSGAPVLPGDRGWQRRRQRPAAVRHVDRRAWRRRAEPIPRLPRRPALLLTAPFTMQATAIPTRPAIRTTTTPARQTRSR